MWEVRWKKRREQSYAFSSSVAPSSLCRKTNSRRMFRWSETNVDASLKYVNVHSERSKVFSWENMFGWWFEFAGTNGGEDEKERFTLNWLHVKLPKPHVDCFLSRLSSEISRLLLRKLIYFDSPASDSANSNFVWGSTAWGDVSNATRVYNLWHNSLRIRRFVSH